MAMCNMQIKLFEFKVYVALRALISVMNIVSRSDCVRRRNTIRCDTSLHSSLGYSKYTEESMMHDSLLKLCCIFLWLGCLLKHALRLELWLSSTFHLVDFNFKH